MIDNPIYHIELTVGGCLILMTLNGFPLVSGPRKSTRTESPPVNHLLVGKGNRLEITATPFVNDKGDLSSIAGVTLRGTVKSFQEGDAVAPETGEVVASFNVAEMISKGQTGFPVHIVVNFDTDGPEFRSLLLDGAAIHAEKDVVRYGLHLRDLLRRGDVAALYTEFEPKLIDFARAYYEDVTDARPEFLDFMSGQFLPARPVVDFGEDRIRAVSYCGGRVWKLLVDPGEEFLTTTPTEEDSRLVIPVYVGLVDGKPHVVR